MSVMWRVHRDRHLYVKRLWIKYLFKTQVRKKWTLTESGSLALKAHFSFYFFWGKTKATDLLLYREQASVVYSLQVMSMQRGSDPLSMVASFCSKKKNTRTLNCTSMTRTPRCKFRPLSLYLLKYCFKEE